MRAIRYLMVASILGFAIFMIANGGAGAGPAGSYRQVNLLANSSMYSPKHLDHRMINAWGIASLGGTDPFWVNDEGTGVSELIDGQGAIDTLLPFVTIPLPGSTHPSRPTGMVANPDDSDGFVLPDGSSALFIFDTIDGTIAGWNTDNRAVTVINNSSKAQYFGLAMAANGSNPFLYAANGLGSVDVFDSSFHQVTPSGGFSDPGVPHGLTPYGIANINGDLFVTYSSRLQVNGAVSEFDPNGNLVTQFATGGKLNQPWAVTIAPANFGPFSNDLLVGNFKDGAINAFNARTGEFLGQLADKTGATIRIPGLWSLVAGGLALNSVPNALYFTAGPRLEHDGLFGFIEANPPPTPRPTRTNKPTPTHTPPVHHPTPTATRTPMPTPTANYGGGGGGLGGGIY